MSTFLIPLVAGFGFNAASAFTAAFCRRWGEHRGQLVTAVLRNVLGIPLWVIGLGLAVRAPSAALFTPSARLEEVGGLLLALGSSSRYSPSRRCGSAQLYRRSTILWCATGLTLICAIRSTRACCLSSPP